VICRAHARDRDTGSVTIVMLLLAVSLFAVCGLVIDGGRAITARQRAANHAEQAARAGAAALSEQALRGGQIRLDPAAARGAALAFLRRTGEAGAVTVSGDRVTVHVRTSIRTGMLGLLGKHRFDVAATATARPVRALGLVQP
jgi:Flp pilus assembly protein TadG